MYLNTVEIVPTSEVSFIKLPNSEHQGKLESFVEFSFDREMLLREIPVSLYSIASTGLSHKMQL